MDSDCSVGFGALMTDEAARSERIRTNTILLEEGS